MSTRFLFFFFIYFAVVAFVVFRYKCSYIYIDRVYYIERFNDEVRYYRHRTNTCLYRKSGCTFYVFEYLARAKIITMIFIESMNEFIRSNEKRHRFFATVFLLVKNLLIGFNLLCVCVCANFA